MAYTSKNRLLKILEIQELYLKHKKPGVFTRTIFKKHIEPRYKISRATFYNYLSVNAKKQLREMSERCGTADV